MNKFIITELTKVTAPFTANLMSEAIKPMEARTKLPLCIRYNCIN